MQTAYDVFLKTLVGNRYILAEFQLRTINEIIGNVGHYMFILYSVLISNRVCVVPTTNK